jgi:hypothetical protein
VNDLFPETTGQSATNNPSIQKLLNIPFIVTEDLYLVTISQTYMTPPSLNAAMVASILPNLAIASRQLLEFSKVCRLINQLTLGKVVSHLSTAIRSGSVEDVIRVEPDALRRLYSLFSDLDRQSDVDQANYQALRDLPIWLSSDGLIKASQALLPGDFNDPIGVSNLLDVNVLTPLSRDFVSVKLKVQTQTIEAFVETSLPRFFNDNGPLDEHKYFLLVSELANHPSLVDNENIRRILGSMSIIPTQDGKWAKPPDTYRYTDELAKVLGDALHLWVDTKRIPDSRSVHNFIDSLGIQQKAKARHLVDRMISIAESSLPTEDAKRSSAEAFYALCDSYEEWKDEGTFHDAIEVLRETTCFPAEGDTETWHMAHALYTPVRSEAFFSQVNILDFKSRSKLETKVLDDIGFTTTPETKLVIDHLLFCAAEGVQPHITTYQILNERAQKEEHLIAMIARSRCIYVETQKTFVRPNQLYWTPQQLGRYAFTIPGNLELFRPLFAAIGVKNSPEAKDYVDILLDIVGEHYVQTKAVTGPDRSVYSTCLSGIATAYEMDQLEFSDLCRLQEAPTILNLMDRPAHPDEIFLQDSEWHAGFFNGELDQALCKPNPELWPFLKEIGVKRLSECAEVKLEFIDGPESSEALLAEKIVERADILARLLYDKPDNIRKNICKTLFQLDAISYEIIHIQATVYLDGNQVSAPPIPAYAFFDSDNCKLILSRPVSDRSWSHILNSLFHQLMPEESSSEISKLTLSVRPLMGMSVEAAHRELTDAGIPLLELESAKRTDDLTSPQLEDIGGAQESCSEPAAISGDEPLDKRQGDTKSSSSKNEYPTDGQPNGDRVRPDESPQSNTNQPLGSSGPGGSQNPPQTGSLGTPINAGSRSQFHADTPQKTKRAKHKTQWDRRLLSYVRKKVEGCEESIEGDDSSEHNLAVEAIARNAVALYEKVRGRVAEQMPQTHPGYDIISHNPITGEERFIEVKGINGEWNQTGVGLSKLQFSNAQDYGDNYWLYVVELISDPENLRIHPICNPSSQVTAFMFDGKWRDAVIEESADPSLAFIEGVMVEHQHYGIGKIVSMKLRGSTRVMRIDFEQGGEKTVSLNLSDMKVIEDDYGEDDS